MAEIADQPDLELLHRYLTARDAEAFALLARRHAAMVFSTARRVTGNTHDAEDVAQACFLELARRAGQVKSSLAGWLHSLAVSRAKNFVRDAAVRSRHERAPADPSQASVPSSQREAPDWELLCPHIDAALAELPEDLREALVMQFLEGRAQWEIARELGVSQPTVSRRVASGIDRLRATLASRGITSSVGGLAVALPSIGSAGQTVPATLQASLGKLAISGVGGPTLPAAKAAVAASFLSRIVPLLTGKAGIFIIGAALVGGGILGVGYWYRNVYNSPRSIEITGLIWGTQNSGQQTLAGSIVAASRSLGRSIDYTTVMGDSGLAFRTRWTSVRDGNGDPYVNAAAYDAEPLGALGRAAGVRLRPVGAFGWNRASVRPFAVDIDRSLAAGRPVIVEDRHDRAFGLLVAILGDDRYTLREYSDTGHEVEVSLDDLGGGVILIEADDARAPGDRRQAVVASLRAAVADWNRPSDGAGGRVHHGRRAWDLWLSETTNARTRDEAAQRVMWRQSWWTYSQQLDARFHAARYLRQSAELLPSREASLLLAAATEYEKLTAGLEDSVYRSTSGPWTDKPFESWQPVEEAAWMARARDIDAAAMRLIEQAAKGM